MAVLALRVVRGAAASCAAVPCRDCDDSVVRRTDPVSDAALDIERRIPNIPRREQLSKLLQSGGSRRHMVREDDGRHP